MFHSGSYLSTFTHLDKLKKSFIQEFIYISTKENKKYSKNKKKHNINIKKTVSICNLIAIIGIGENSTKVGIKKHKKAQNK